MGKELMPSFESSNEYSLAYIFMLRIWELGGGWGVGVGVERDVPYR